MSLAAPIAALAVSLGLILAGLSLGPDADRPRRASLASKAWKSRENT